MTAFAVLASVAVFAQGVTTGALSGKVVDQKGEGLPGATVVAVHTPSGTQYGTSTRADGRYVIPNARVGGPYKVTISFIGFEAQERNDVYISLGNTSDISATLQEGGTQLQEVQVVASSVMSSERTGASTNVNNRTIQSVPTISRGLRDFTKLNPLANTAGNGTSFAGMNNRYNQFSIDGLVSNDVFGLTSSGTNGGQTGIEPISLDAIEEFQLNIAPYDVRQGGFTGGGINAVTRSGSNTFQGSVYYFGNNQSLVGRSNPNTEVKAKYPEYSDYQTGFRLGGPIIKNKLFFFINGELTRKKTPLPLAPGSATNVTGSNITADEVTRVKNVLTRIAPNYDPGASDVIENETNSDKILAKIDWNINSNHKLSVRHSYTYGENIDNSRSSNAFRFYNNGVYFPSKTNSTGVELNSIFGTQFSNRLMIGYTRVRDDRDPLGNPFPTVLLNIGNGRTITLGSEASSVANQLDQDIYSLTDDFSIYAGKHTITIGTNNEFYKFYNLFVQNIYGNYAYNSLANFETVGTAGEVAPTFYQVGYSFANDGLSQSAGGAKFNAFQLGLYGQDDIQVFENLKVTAGLRIDLPVFPDKPEGNTTFNEAYGSRGGTTGTVPDSKILWSPRVGFNWDVMGDRSLQVRGGTGLFTGRVPFVWVSNQFSNNGQLNGTFSIGNSSASSTPIANPAGVKFNANPATQATAETYGRTPGRGAINVIDKDFRFPQVFRTNLAVDKTLPWGLVGTIEGIFSKTLNNINFVNWNREVDPGFAFNGPDNRPRYKNGRVDANYDEIIYLQNTNKGYSYNVMAQIQKSFTNGFMGSIAYSYGDSKDLNSGTSSVAYSNWRYVNNVNGLNDLSQTRSNYSAGSRVVGLVSYRKEYLNNLLATQISLFYNGQSGQPISYRYDGDINNDGTSNDMIYIPRTAADINLIDYTTTGTNPVTVTAAEQWAKLDAYIEGDDYLKEHRGEYAERNASRMPFQHNFDLRILQEVAVKAGATTNKLQFSLDILNVGNFINKDWGRQYTVSNQEFALIAYKGLAADGKTPTYNYNPSNQTNNNPWSASDLISRWRMQLGVRYIFN